VCRPLRPPALSRSFKNEVQSSSMCFRPTRNDADVLGLTAASAALSMSKCHGRPDCRRARRRVEGAWILNPTSALEFSRSRSDRVRLARIDRDGRRWRARADEAEIVKALEVAHKGIKELLDISDEVVEAMQQPKMEWVKAEPPAPRRARQGIGGRQNC